MYTIEFQRQLIKLLYTDLNFYNNLGTLIEATYFDSQPLRTLYSIINNYLQTYEKEPSESDLSIMLGEYCINRGYGPEAKELLEKEFISIVRCHIASHTFITDKVVKFIRNQRFKAAIIQAVDIMEKDEGKFELVVKSIDAALSIGAGIDKGLTYHDLKDFLAQYRRIYDKGKLLRTGFPTFDDALLGGMAPGELHILTAPPGRGKSTFGVNVGSWALIQGAMVVHITLELKEIDVLAKYACRMSGLSYGELMTTGNEDFFERMKRFDHFKPDLYVKYYTPNTINAHTIRAFCSRIRSETGKSPGLIIIDYDDYLLPVGGAGESMYENSGDIYADLIGLGDYYKCFTPETKISLFNSTEVPIIDLVGKDKFWVYSYDTSTNSIVPGLASNCRKTKSNVPVLKVTLDNGESIRCTYDHRFLTKDNKYIEAQNLEVSQSLKSLYRKVSKEEKFINTVNFQMNHKVVFIEPDGVSDVYDFTVEKYHNFALSAGVFVHNCPILSFSQPQRDAWQMPDRGEVITMGSLAHSAKKAHLAYSVSSLNVPRSDMSSGILYVDKVRRGKDNLRIRINLDLSRSTITETVVEQENTPVVESAVVSGNVQFNT